MEINMKMFCNKGLKSKYRGKENLPQPVIYLNLL